MRLALMRVNSIKLVLRLRLETMLELLISKLMLLRLEIMRDQVGKMDRVSQLVIMPVIPIKTNMASQLDIKQDKQVKAVPR